MTPAEFLESVADKTIANEPLADLAATDTTLLKTVFDGLAAKPANTKYGCAKVLLLIAEAHPKKLSRYWSRLTDLLSHEKNVLRWTAIKALAHLSTVDSRDRISDIIDDYLAPMLGPNLPTAGNIIEAGVIIASARPKHLDRIVSILLQIESAEFETQKCRNIALGKAFAAMGKLFADSDRKTEILQMAERQKNNPHPATARKASVLLRSHEAQSHTLQGGDVLDRVRKICLALPDTKETMTWGKPHFRVGEKIFAGYGERDGRPSIGFKLEKPHAAARVKLPNFSVAAYVGKHGWVDMDASAVDDWDDVTDLIHESYRLIAPPKSRAKLK